MSKKTFSKLFTWLDIRRVISHQTNYGSKFPEGVVRIRCFSDALEIGLNHEEESRENAQQALKEWFGDWYQEEELLIQLDLGDATLPVEFIPGSLCVHFGKKLLILMVIQKQKIYQQNRLNFQKHTMTNRI
jgi:hypothetical protein